LITLVHVWHTRKCLDSGYKQPNFEVFKVFLIFLKKMFDIKNYPLYKGDLRREWTSKSEGNQRSGD